jgi:hypothetical protein
MIKKLKAKTSHSMLDFALEINKDYKVKKIEFGDKKLDKLFNYEKKKQELKSNAFINGNLKANFSLKKFEEDNKENQKKAATFPKPQKIEFLGENKEVFKFFKFEERNVKFTKSKILPKIKLMKVDNDVLTDSEQVKDAISMMKDNLQETINHIKKNPDYLKKNLTNKIKFKKGKL